MAYLNLRGVPPMTGDMLIAFNSIKDENLKEAVVHVRNELWGMSTRAYFDRFEAALTFLKEDMGTPDEEVGELLAEGLDRLAEHVAALDPKRWNSTMFPKG